MLVIPFLTMSPVSAAGNCAESAKDLKKLVEKSGSYSLCSNIATDLEISKNITLDLRGKTLTGEIELKKNNQLIINDSIGGGKITGDIEAKKIQPL